MTINTWDIAEIDLCKANAVWHSFIIQNNLRGNISTSVSLPGNHQHNTSHQGTAIQLQLSNGLHCCQPETGSQKRCGSYECVFLTQSCTLHMPDTKTSSSQVWATVRDLNSVLDNRWQKSVRYLESKSHLQILVDNGRPHASSRQPLAAREKGLFVNWMASCCWVFLWNCLLNTYSTIGWWVAADRHIRAN